MGGLALGIGRLVDDSIVELENIQRHLNVDRQPVGRHLNAAREVAMPIFASTVTTVVVFLPMFFIVGIARLLLIPLTVTIAIALFTSFFVSRTVTPALCYRFFKSEQEAHRQCRAGSSRSCNGAERRYEALEEGYERAFAGSWPTAGHCCISVVVIFVESLALVPFIGTEFLPVSDESQFRIVLRAPVGQRVEKTVEQVAEVERVLREKIPPDGT